MPYKDPTSAAARASQQRRASRYHEKNREARLEENRRWREANRERIRQREAERRAADPEKVRQRVRIKAAARKAHPVRQICEIDGCVELGERHHDDYSKPLKIRWLCHRHHISLEHRKVIL